MLAVREQIDHFAGHRYRVARARRARRRPTREHVVDHALEMHKPLPQRTRPLRDIDKRPRGIDNRYLHMRAADIPAEYGMRHIRHAIAIAIAPAAHGAVLPTKSGA